MDQATSSLSAHKDTNLVTREQLALLPEVIATDTFKPIPHIELVVKLEEVLEARGIHIARYESGAYLGQRREQFAISKTGDRLFGTLDLTREGIAGTCASLGLRTANNRTMALQMIAGLRIFVCDNMAFSGDTIMMRRRHTSGLNLLDELFIAMDRYEKHFTNLRAEVTRLQSYQLTAVAAKVLLHDVFAAQVMPVRLFPEVSDVYFNRFVTSDEPKYAAFSDRSAWSLLNAFTEVAKEMPLTTRIKATQVLGAKFGALVR